MMRGTWMRTMIWLPAAADAAAAGRCVSAKTRATPAAGVQDESGVAMRLPSRTCVTTALRAASDEASGTISPMGGSGVPAASDALMAVACVSDTARSR